MGMEVKLALEALLRAGFFESQIRQLQSDATAMLIRESSVAKPNDTFRAAFFDFAARQFQLNTLLELAKKAKRELEEERKPK